MKNTRLSKLIDQVIRQQARDYALEMNSAGFMPLEGLVNIVTWKTGCSMADILAVIENGERGRKRFEVCGEMIRARPQRANARPFTTAV